MPSIIYIRLIDNEIDYVGSAFEARYESRQREHRNRLLTLFGINPNRVKFKIASICEDHLRYEVEGLHIDQLKLEGYELSNSIDPRQGFVPNYSAKTRTKEQIEKQKRTIEETNKERRAIQRLYLCSWDLAGKILAQRRSGHNGKYTV